MIILPKLVHDRKSLVRVLACLQAEPISNLRKNLLRQVIDTHETDWHSIFVFTMRVAVIKLEDFVELPAKLDGLPEDFLQSFNLFV